MPTPDDVRSLWLRAVLADRELPLRCKVTATALFWYLNWHDLGGAWPGHDALAAETGLSERTISRAIRELLAHKWLGRKRRSYPGGWAERSYRAEYYGRFPPGRRPKAATTLRRAFQPWPCSMDGCGRKVTEPGATDCGRH